MNPDHEKFIPQVIELHKQGTGNILDWSSLRTSIPDLYKSDRDGLRLAMIKMGVIEPSTPGNAGSTRLIDYYFDLGKYKRDKQQEEDKKDIDYELVKKQLKDYPEVKDRAQDAITISKIALLISGLGLLLLLIKWIFFGL
jgi:hypothetical protein